MGIVFLNSEFFGSVGNIGKEADDAVICVNNAVFNTISFHIEPPLGGSVGFEESIDGESWENFSLRSTTNDIFKQSVDIEEHFKGSIAGSRLIRFRTLTAGSAPGTIIGQFSPFVSTLEGIEFNAPPHRFGFLPESQDFSFTTSQTATTLWAPDINKNIHITDFAIIVGGTQDGLISIFRTDDLMGHRLFRGNIAVTTNRQFSFSQSLVTPFDSGTDESIKFSSSEDMIIDLMIQGYQS